jgi:hypothetical protein
MFFALLSLSACQPTGPRSLFDGSSFDGWEGDTEHTWRIEDGAIVGGSLTETVPHNHFLASTTSYGDFILRLRYKLQGEEGFVNAGVQFRSERIEEPAYEMAGYQADIGDKLDGALYDESRRNRFLAGPDSIASRAIVKQGDWNEYEIRAKGSRIQIYLNGQQTVEYTEPEPDLPQRGRIALQVHGGGKTLVRYQDITIKEL